MFYSLMQNQRCMYKIEFIKGEPFCRANGEITTKEWSEKNLGTDEEFVIGDDFILTEEFLYLKKMTVESVLLAVGTFHGAQKPYDAIASQGYGSTRHYTASAILGDKNAIVVKQPEVYEGVIIKPMREFKKDFPNFNKKKYMGFYNSLEQYYKDLRTK